MLNKRENRFKSFNYSCFYRYILNYHGNPVIVEDYEEDYYDENNPDACFDDYGSCVYDVKNNKYTNIRNFFLTINAEEAEKEIDNLAGEWEDLNKDSDDVRCDIDFNEVRQRYLEKIEEFEKMDPKPESLDISRPL